MNTAFNLSFAFEGSSIRVGGEPDAPIFCAQDVCDALEISNSRDLLAKSVPDDEKTYAYFDTPGGVQRLLCLREPGLYRVIFRSYKPRAEDFRSWVFREVLPSVRLTGRYEVGQCTGLEDEPGAEGVDVRLRSMLWITKALVQLGAKPDRAADVASRAIPRLLGAAGGAPGRLAAVPVKESAERLLAQIEAAYPEGWEAEQRRIAREFKTESTPLATVLRAALQYFPERISRRRTGTARYWVFQATNN